MITVYATPAELALWLDPVTVPTPDPPTNAMRLLRAASNLVSDQIAAAVYSTTVDGLPTDEAKAEAIKNATLEHAATLALNGIDPALGTAQVKRRVKSKALGNGSASTTYEDGDAYLLALADGDELTTDAWRYLDNAGLISNRVGAYPRGISRSYPLSVALGGEGFVS